MSVRSECDDTAPWNLRYGDRHLGPQDFDPAEALRGYGTVGERAVRCIASEWQVRSHTGYAVDEDDWRDVSALCERFGIAVPPDYDDFVGGRR
jgi:hypothetical protein